MGRARRQHLAYPDRGVGARRPLTRSPSPNCVRRALTELLDASLIQSLGRGPGGRLALVAVGSYARSELCPGSDVDVVLVHDGRGEIAAVADRLWYPLWDAGFILGHATNTVKEEVALAERDLDALTALLDARLVTG